MTDRHHDPAALTYSDAAELDAQEALVDRVANAIWYHRTRGASDRRLAGVALRVAAGHFTADEVKAPQ